MREEHKHIRRRHKHERDDRPEMFKGLKLSKTTKKPYVILKGAMMRLCDDILKTEYLSHKELGQIARLRARIEIEM